jgi:hypothetical protein
MFLQATTTTSAAGAPGEMEIWSSGTGSDECGFQHHRPRSDRMRPVLPSSDILYSQRSQRLPSFSGEGGGSTPPQLNSGVSSQQRTYQTHIFAPLVAGAPVKKSKFIPTSIGSVPPGTGNGNGSVSGGVTPLGESSAQSIVFVLFIIIGGFSIERGLSECTSYAISAVSSSKYARTNSL